MKEATDGRNAMPIKHKEMLVVINRPRRVAIAGYLAHNNTVLPIAVSRDCSFFPTWNEDQIVRQSLHAFAQRARGNFVCRLNECTE